MNNRKGVTLIELLVVLSVLGLVLIPVLGILNFSTRQFGSQTGRAQTILLANQAMNAICKEAGRAVSTAPDALGNLYFVMPGNTDTGGNYVPVQQSGKLTYTSGVLVQFYIGNPNGKNVLGNHNLWRQTLAPDLKGTPDNAWSLTPGTNVPLFPNVTALTFSTTGMPANTVRVSLTMTDTEGGQTSTETVTRSVYLSNHN